MSNHPITPPRLLGTLPWMLAACGLCLLGISSSRAQVFTDVTSGPLGDISGGTAAWGDYDNDGELLEFTMILDDGSGGAETMDPPLDLIASGEDDFDDPLRIRSGGSSGVGCLRRPRVTRPAHHRGRNGSRAGPI